MVRLFGAVWAIVCAQTVVAQQLFPPSFTSSPGTTITEGARYQYSITILDADALDTVAITGSALPNWLTLTDNGNRTATLTGTPGAANVGPNLVTLVASDGVNSAQQSFTIAVTAVNDPPVFTSTAPTAATQGVLYTYTATATDPDGDTLTFATPTRPSWLTLSVRRSQALRGKPTSARTSHDTVSEDRGAGRAIVPNSGRGRERSAGLHKHRADNRYSRCGVHLYRDGYRS